MAAHLAPRFGRTVQEFSADGFDVEQPLECLLDSDTDLGMAKTIGLGVLGMAERLAALRPDLLLLIADRYEMLAPASAALALRIPIAHIEGGEISEGAIDDAVRNALTKMSHLHFVSTELARRRVLAMGEEAWRVTRAGAPSLDHFQRSALPQGEKLEAALGRPLPASPWLVSIHPTTLAADPTADARALFGALDGCNEPIVISFPNADAGYQEIIELATDFCRHHAQASLHVNLGIFNYLGLLKQAALMVGNSSSGIMESPSLAMPCVNVGMRQQGRERAPNIIDAPRQVEAIRAAIEQAKKPAFRDSLAGMTNPYGDGQAGQRIAKILSDCPLGPDLLIKRALPLNANADAFVQQPD